ncbi:MAG: N-acetylmuramic acid 6-phosphate etherase [Trueperaceae bacterium]|nr:N-acetylmuramic acid 6-phosphate etherase [Trueperaceae bacterium]
MTEAIDPTFDGFDGWSMARRLEVLVLANSRAVAAVAAALPDLTRAADGLAARLLRGGRIVYVGAGTSGRLALQDAAELPPTFDFDATVVLLAGGAEAGETASEGAEDDALAASRAVDEADVGPLDALIALAASGRTPYTVAAVEHARARGAFTIGIANNPGTPLLAAAHVGVLLDTGPEVVAGSTRLVAGTAQKIALNALSTAPMAELGAVHGNLMVAMRPKNEKLRRRAVQIVQSATGAAEETARAALEDGAWDLRVAIVMLDARVPSDLARRLLTAHGGRVRAAIAGAADG